MDSDDSMEIAADEPEAIVPGHHHGGTSRFWLYTIWTWPIDVDSVRDAADFVYCVWQRERAPHTGRLHVQLYLELKRPQRHSWFPNKLGLAPGDYWAGIKRGSRDDARKYCRKDESRVEGPWEIGTWKEDRGPGARNDIQAVADAVINERPSIPDLAKRFPTQFIKYHRGIERLNTVVNRPARREEARVVIVLEGPTGTGKTKWATETYEEIYEPAIQGSAVWWDNYQGEDVLLLDDYDSGLWPYRTILKVTDRRNIHVPVKGGSIYWTGGIVVFTTNVDPERWYPNQNGGVPELWRRVTHYRKYDAEAQEWYISEMHPDKDESEDMRLTTRMLETLGQ